MLESWGHVIRVRNLNPHHAPATFACSAASNGSKRLGLDFKLNVFLCLGLRESQDVPRVFHQDALDGLVGESPRSHAGDDVYQDIVVSVASEFFETMLRTDVVRDKNLVAEPLGDDPTDVVHPFAVVGHFNLRVVPVIGPLSPKHVPLQIATVLRDRF